MMVASIDIQKLYIAYFGRPADVAGLAHWLNYAQHQPLTSIASQFGASPEYQQMYAGKTAEQVVNALYLNMFGRAAEAAGLSYWTGLLSSGVVTIDSIALAFIEGAQSTDQAVLQNKATAAAAFTQNLDVDIEISAYANPANIAQARSWLAAISFTEQSLNNALALVNSTIAKIVTPPAPPAPPSEEPAPSVMSFTLTAGVDSFTGDALGDTFVAGAGMLNAGDVLNGAGGYDVLRITADGQTLLGTRTSIEEVRLVDGATLNVSGSNIGNFAFGHDATTDTNAVTLHIDAGGASTWDWSGVSAGQKGSSTSSIRATYTNAATTSLNVTLTGLDDVFVGSDAADTIRGGAGADHLSGAGGDDLFIGFEGKDTIDGGNGTNTLQLTATSTDLNEATNVQLLNVSRIDASSATAAVTVKMSAQTESLELIGSNYGDVLRGGQGADTIRGGDGDDTFLEFDGADHLDGGMGVNTLKLTGIYQYTVSGSDSLFQNISHVDASGATASIAVSLTEQTEGFSITGSLFNDVLHGGLGNDTLIGGEGNDSLYGGLGVDALYGGAGDDYLHDSDSTLLGSHTLDGGAGNDTLDCSGSSGGLYGGEGDDSLIGGAWADTLDGGAGSDTLYAGAGQDVLYGGDGNDYLTGGAGADTLDGGAGVDYFVYNSVGDGGVGGDTILNFDISDKIRLQGGDFAYIDSATHIKAISGEGMYNSGDGYGFDGGAYALLYADSATGKVSLIYDDNGNDTAGGYSVLIGSIEGYAITLSMIEVTMF